MSKISADLMAQFVRDDRTELAVNINANPPMSAGKVLLQRHLTLADVRNSISERSYSLPFLFLDTITFEPLTEEEEHEITVDQVLPTITIQPVTCLEEEYAKIKQSQELREKQQQDKLKTNDVQKIFLDP